MDVCGLCQLILLPRRGFLKLLQQALRVRPDGLGAFGIPCGSYIFLNCPTHLRSEERPFGNEDLPYVAVANLSFPELSDRIMLNICWVCCANTNCQGLSCECAQDRMPNGIDTTCAGLQGSPYICGAARVKQAFYGALLHLCAINVWEVQHSVPQQFFARC